MTDIKHINDLYKEHGDALERKYAFIKNLKETYNIPTEDIAPYYELEDACISTRDRYWSALVMPWWEKLWYKLTTRKQY